MVSTDIYVAQPHINPLLNNVMTIQIQPQLQEILNQIDVQPALTSRLFRALSFTVKQIQDPTIRRQQAEAVADACEKKADRFGRSSFLAACNLSSRNVDHDI